jgi:uncharacterized protein DUF4258
VVHSSVVNRIEVEQSSAPDIDPMLPSMVSPHARARMQQRGIPTEHVEQVLAFGCEVHDGHGGVIVYFDRAARRRAERAHAATRNELDRLAGMYVVMAVGGVVATVGHRYRRVRRR